MLTELSEKIYAEGGILSVTSRILVVDLLSSMFATLIYSTVVVDIFLEILDSEKVTGIVVLHADKYVIPCNQLAQSESNYLAGFWRPQLRRSLFEYIGRSTSQVF